MSHTQRKLRVGERAFKDSLYDERGDCVAVCLPLNRQDNTATAARPAHCWNQHDELVAQRNALLETLQQALDALENERDAGTVFK